MTTQKGQNSQKLTKQSPPAPPNNATPPALSASRSSSLSHYATIELKQRIIVLLNKLADRDTQQIAMEDLEKTIQTLTPEFITACLNCLYDTDALKGNVKKDSLRLLGTMACSHPDSVVSAHLPKMISHIVKRLREPDSSVRDACHATVGVLSAQFLGGEGPIVSVFVKPFLDALAEQNKTVQGGSAMCLSKIIENAKSPVPVGSFQKLCPRFCKHLSNPNFLAKAPLVTVLGSLSQVGAISQQHVGMIMTCICESLESSDWNSRKAAADTLIRMANHSSHVFTGCKSSIIKSLEDCRFDKVKPVRDSVTEALQLWKSVSGDGAERDSGEFKNSASDKSEGIQTLRKMDTENSNPVGRKTLSPLRSSQEGSCEAASSNSNTECDNVLDKTTGLLKKKAPLNEKGLNPDFFQKHEKKDSDEWKVEIAVPKSRPQSSQSLQEGQTEDNSERPVSERVGTRATNGVWKSSGISGSENDNSGSNGLQRNNITYNGNENVDDFSQDRWMERRSVRNRESSSKRADFDDREFNPKRMDPDDWSDNDQREACSTRGHVPRGDNYSEAQSPSGRSSISMIQRQLMQMERQQANLMEMLQEYMGNSQDNMIALESRVRSLERFVEDIARDLSFSSGRRGIGHAAGYEGPASNRHSNKYYGQNEFSGPKFGRGGDIRNSFPDRYSHSEAGRRELQWRGPEGGGDAWDAHPHGSYRGNHFAEGPAGSRRGVVGAGGDVRFARQEQVDGDQVVSRRGWDRGPTRLGEGPSARSVWKAAKDEETLAAIRVAGEDAEASRASSRQSVPELDCELSEYNNEREIKGTDWAAWSRILASLHAGDLDSAYSEALFTGDETLLVKLMNKSGPVLEQLSTGTVTEILHAISQLFQQQSFFELGIYWVQQVVDMVIENGPECLPVPVEVKKELLVSLHESSNMELPEDWEGITTEDLLIQLANSWSIELPQGRPRN